MIEKLEKLTLSQFIDMVCGNTDALLSRHEVANPDKLAIAVRNIVMEYRGIADPGGVQTYLNRIESWVKAKIGVIVFTMCFNLTSLKQYDKAREVLSAYGLSVAGWTDSRVEGTVKARQSQAQRELDKLEEENAANEIERETIRSRFDMQTAALMAHFRFQIDPDSIKASLYANLVARYNREIKAQVAAMRKK